MDVRRLGTVVAREEEAVGTGKSGDARHPAVSALSLDHSSTEGRIMEPRITHATAVGGFRVALAFADGTQGVVDLT